MWFAGVLRNQRKRLRQSALLQQRNVCRVGTASKAYTQCCLFFKYLFSCSSLPLQITSRTKYLVRCMERNVAPRAHVIIRKTHTTKVLTSSPTSSNRISFTAIQISHVVVPGAHSPWDFARIQGLKAPAHDKSLRDKCQECHSDWMDGHLMTTLGVARFLFSRWYPCQPHHLALLPSCFRQAHHIY